MRRIALKLGMLKLFNNLVRVYRQMNFKIYTAHLMAMRDLGRILSWLPPERESTPYNPVIYYEVHEDEETPSGIEVADGR